MTTATKSKPRKSLRDEVAAVLKTRDGKRLSGRAIARKLGRSAGQVSAIVREIRGRKAEVIMPSDAPTAATAEVQDKAPLSTAESDSLAAHEAVIEEGLATFVGVGTALMEIREHRLYRGDYATFEAYCQERWGMTRGRANQLVRAAEVVGNLDTNGIQTPTSERQVRPIADLPSGQQKEVWDEAVAQSNGHAPTARKVREVRETVAPKAKPKGKVKPPPPAAVDAAIEDDPLGDEERRAIQAEGNGEEVGGKAADEPTDDRKAREDREWLETLTLRAKLSDRCRAIFDDDALAYREAGELILGLRRVCQAHEKGRPPGQKVGVWLGQVGAAVRMPHPRGGERKGKHQESGWLGCADCIRDGKHTGLTAGKQDCSSCKGRGYHVPGVRG
jgi:hypothetical protein